MNQLVKRSVIAFVSLCLAGWLSGCSTIEGLGQDIVDISRGVRDAMKQETSQ